MTYTEITMQLALQAQYGQEMCQQYYIKFHSDGYFIKKKLEPVDTCTTPSMFVKIMLIATLKHYN